MTTATATVAPAGAKTPKMVTLKIDGQSVTVPEGTSVYDAAKQAGIYIPVLCHKENLTPVGVCRACVCDVKGGRVYAAACMRAVEDNMEVSTTNPKLDATRATIIELLLSDHPVPCAKHKEDRSCELEIIAEKLGIREPIYTPRAATKGTDASNPSIAIDHSACIVCDRCVRACTDVAHNEVIGRMGKGYTTSISFDNNKPMGTSSCVNCGECMIHCPTGAITYSGGAHPAMEGAKLDAKDIQQIPLFKGINREFLRRSEGAVAVRTFNKGEVICRQGEFGSSAFYVDSGSVSIYIEGAENFGHVRTKKEAGIFNRMKSLLMSRDQDQRNEEGEKRYIPIDASSVDLTYDKPLATVGEGELIGEAACLNYQPRSATVVAAEDETIVFEMLRNVLDILRRNREFKRQMEAKYRARALDNHLRSVAVFRDLPKEFIDYLRDRVELVAFNPGEVICKQGETADAFYLVRMGHVKVYENYADGQGLVLTYLSRSQYFGEIGLLGGGVRTANCSALDHVECVKIGKKEFDEMLAQFPKIRERLQKEANARVEQNRERITQLARVSLPQYINQGLYQAQSLLILDLEKCTRCDECVRACAQAHDNVTRLVREGLRFDKYLVTTSCRSCRDPYCMVGCPVGSIRRKGDMQILIEDHCIGCGRCAEQCPYGNINMHPFTVNFQDPITGEKKTREGRKAAVCDLCDDQCLGENADPSCVYACPHDAAHRVDGQTFFDELVRGSSGGVAK